MEAMSRIDWCQSARLQSHRCAVALAAVTLLFTLRVIAQAIQYMHPTRLLPAFEAFQGSALPYAVLLPLQLLIVFLMSGITLSVAGGQVAPERARGARLRFVGVLYASGSMARLAIGLTLPAAPAWFTAWIPALFHLVLAAFVLLLAAFHLRRL